jgi:hypothetical protein
LRIGTSYIITTMTSGQSRIHPEPSHDLGLVGQAAIEEIVPCGLTLVSIVRVSTGLAGVITGDVVAVAPAIVGVVVATAVAARSAIVRAVVRALVGAIGVAGGATFGRAKGSNFDVLGDDLFGELFVAGREIRKHLAIGGCGRGKVCEGIGGFRDEGVHGIVGAVVSSFLGGALGKTEIKMCFGEVGLEVGPGCVRWRLPTPFTARLGKEAGTEHD